MRRAFFALMVVFLLAAGTSIWAACPAEPDDAGECDTLIVEEVDNMDTITVFPALYRVMIRISHDQTAPADSIGGFSIPLSYTSSNAAAYCSASAYWNTISISQYDPAILRSIFRDMPSSEYLWPPPGTDPPEGTIFNRMFEMGRDFSNRDWDTKQLTLDGTGNFWLGLAASGTPDQWWWEGNRVLLATMTFRIYDTTTICIDTTFWPPAQRVSFVPTTGEFFPRDNMPKCFPEGGNAVHEITGSPDSRPSEFSLSQNYPNPFNPITNIRFSVFKTANVKIEVFNIVGQKVKTLIDEEMAAGVYMVDWDGKDESGKAVSSGIYFYRMQAGDEFTDMKKMLLVK